MKPHIVLRPLRHPSAALRAGFEVVPFQSRFRSPKHLNSRFQGDNLKQKTVFLAQNRLKTAQKRPKTAFNVY
jgi:hypothetical protein